MTRTKILLTAVLVLGLAGTATAAFENVDVSPRARAMGDAAMAVADDAFAPYFNPAGLAGRTGSTLGNSYVKPYSLDFTDQLYLGGAFPLGKLGGVGFGLRRFATEYEGVELHSETTWTLAHGIRLFDDVHSTIDFGWAVNLYQLEFGETISGLDPGDDVVAGVDAGLMVRLHQRTRLGVQVKNINNPGIGVDNEELPQRLHAGVAYEPYADVTTIFEIESALGYDTQYHGGIEFRVLDALALRTGILTNPGKLTAGFGYEVEGFAVNYGFSSGGGVLRPSHQFGLTF
ncbi:hypothetical protein KDK88_01990, partial [bacterium]|nr:hypothetical protein [bacterium]